LPRRTSASAAELGCAREVGDRERRANAWLDEAEQLARTR